MSDRAFLIRAVELATLLQEPVGCGVVIVINNEINAEECSQVTDNIAINRAGIKAITSANKKLGKRNLEGATAYCSCEPCVMCISAMSYAKVQRIVFDKTMKELFPDDPQAKMDSRKFTSELNFVPELQHTPLS